MICSSDQIFRYSDIPSGADGIITLTIPDGERNYLNAIKLTETVPEPGTLGLVALFGGSILFIRRRLKR